MGENMIFLVVSIHKLLFIFTVYSITILNNSYFIYSYSFLSTVIKNPICAPHMFLDVWLPIGGQLAYHWLYS